MNNTLTVREFDRITCDKSKKGDNDYHVIDKKNFDSLVSFIREYVSSFDECDKEVFFNLYYKKGDTVSINGYVGVISLPNGFQIEVLPKVALSGLDSSDLKEEDLQKTRHVFLKMLSYINYFPISFRNASLSSKKMNIFEIFIRIYIDECWRLVKKGIASAYICTEDNISFYKGKLLVSEHINHNAFRKNKFYMEFDSFEHNRAENRLIKSTLLKLMRFTNSNENSKQIKQLLSYFDNVEESVNFDQDFSKVIIDRNTTSYSDLLSWAAIFLKDQSITMFTGKTNAKALLFKMDKIFELFVAAILKKVISFNNMDLTLSAQDKGKSLLEEKMQDDTQRKIFNLRPDIVIKLNEQPLCVLDTKWKKLTSSEKSNYGISESDMYQMYAYAKRYDVKNVFVIYPVFPDYQKSQSIRLKDLDLFSKQQNNELNIQIKILLIDLSWIVKNPNIDECICYELAHFFEE